MNFCLVFASFLMFFLFFLPHSVSAVSVSILTYPTTITEDAFTLTASISGAATGTNYLRVDIYKDGKTNYFGETFNGSDWYSGSDGKQYLPISVKTGTIWNGTIQARIGDFSNADYDGSGSYRIRLRRYTSSGGSGSEDAALSSQTITIAVPTVTPTPTTIPDPTATPKISKAPTATVIPNKSPTTKPIQKMLIPTLKSKMVDKSIPGISTKSAEKKSTPTRSPSPPKSNEILIKGSTAENLSAVFIIAGGLMVMGCGILIFLKRK
jgi:hypothetical protein